MKYFIKIMQFSRMDSNCCTFLEINLVFLPRISKLIFSKKIGIILQKKCKQYVVAIPLDSCIKLVSKFYTMILKNKTAVHFRIRMETGQANATIRTFNVFRFDFGFVTELRRTQGSSNASANVTWQ